MAAFDKNFAAKLLEGLKLVVARVEQKLSTRIDTLAREQESTAQLLEDFDRRLARLERKGEPL